MKDFSLVLQNKGFQYGGGLGFIAGFAFAKLHDKDSTDEAIRLGLVGFFLGAFVGTIVNVVVNAPKKGKQ